jgi:predicted phage-related endonuclease
MKTTIHNCQQGSQEWLKLREGFDTASEAPASQGKSKYTSRSDLLKQKSSGICPDVDASKQVLFDRGHAAEESARSIAERLLDDDLYPITTTTSVDGVSLLASLDGATMDRSIIWEHKLYSETLAADVRSGNLDPHYTIQMDQQLYVTGAQKCMFMTSDGTEEKMAWCWYESSDEKFAALLAGWKQFRADLAAYVPTESVAAPVGKPPETLPALHIEVTGMVTASNLAEYKSHALAVFASINRELSTDAQFADAEKTVKWCSDIETRLAAAKQHALSQTASIDELFLAIDDISAEARSTRLELDKLVKNREDSIRAEIVADGRNSITSHITALNLRMGMPVMPSMPVDFANAIKGKRTLESMRDAVSTELARAKIAANEVADCIALNLRSIDAHSEYAFLFADVSTLALKDPEFVAMAIKNRIADHQAKEIARLESERTRIAEQERIKAEAKANDQQRQFEALERSEIKRLATLNSTLIVEAVIAKAQAPLEIIAHEVLGPPTLKLGGIAERLGFQVTEAFLKSLGFEPVMRVKSCVLFHECDFPLICQKLIRHIEEVAQGVEA